MDFISKLWEIWNDDQIRLLVLGSLAIQIVLIFLAYGRKYSASRLLSLILWTFYLLADYVATLAIGNLLNLQNQDESLNGDLLAFWSPFLLLHLGGPDTITAYSLEDNELWYRHLLGLIVQVISAILVFQVSLPSPRLWKAVIPVYLAGILKFSERTLALRSGSMDCLRDSLVTPPDPGPNYAKFMEEFHTQLDAGFKAEIIKENEPDLSIPDFDTEPQDINEKDLLSKAYDFFQTFKPMTVDLMLSFHERTKSQSFFLLRWPKEAFKVVEIELSFLYDILYTKAAVVHTYAGRLVRLFTFSMIILSVMLFFIAGKGEYEEADIIITYVLLGAGLGLEIIAIVLLISSDWTFIWLKGIKYDALAKRIFDMVSYFRPRSKPQWSNCMSQFNLIGFCLIDQPFAVRKILGFFRIKETWDVLWCTARIVIRDELKDLIFDQLKSMAMSVEDSTGYKHFHTYRGEWVLRQMGHRKLLGWSVEAEFDESILFWHIATDLCYYDEKGNENANKEMSRDLSNYMLYLLVLRPSMLTAGIGKIRFGDTCAEAKNFFQQIDWSAEKSPAWKKVEEACKVLLNVATEIPPIEVKGDRSKSVLFDACRLAKFLKGVEPAEKRWRVVSVVWVEMLCFAASNCRGYFHVKQLSQGGELLTHVWFLMAHLGMGQQYRIEAGHARAKLIVEK